MKALADYLFGRGEAAARLVRLDMSEFAGPGAARRLVLQADGQPSELIRRIRAQPFSVVLLDEIEKAADEVFDMLLGLFDEGRLTDEYGRVAVFRSAVIVMTSNLGADALRTIGFRRDETPAYESEAFSFFRPEFFNRFDEVVTFNALDTVAIRDITRIELEAVSRREGPGHARAADPVERRSRPCAGRTRLRRPLRRPVPAADDQRGGGRAAVLLAGGPGRADETRRLTWSWVATAVCDAGRPTGSRRDFAGPPRGPAPSRRQHLTCCTPLVSLLHYRSPPQSASSHSSTDASVRHPAGPAVARVVRRAFASACRFMSRPTVAYRCVVVTLAP